VPSSQVKHAIKSRGGFMKIIYLVLAIVGAIVPYVFFFEFIQNSGLDITAFASALFVNGAAGGFSADLLFSSFVFWLYMFHQTTQNKNLPKPYFFIMLNLTIGLSCALPAYLYAKESEL